MALWGGVRRVGEERRASAGRADPAGSRFVPRARWILAAVALIVLANVLFVEAYTNARFAPDATHAGSTGDGVPGAITEGGPVIDAAAVPPRSYRLPARTIALTFDDGPDPRWTRKFCGCFAPAGHARRSSWWAPRSPAIPG